MSGVRKSTRLLFTVLFFITLACSSICISPLYAEDITEIVVFGDSLSDTGNLYVATMLDPDEDLFPASPPYYYGRFSNGLVWVEYLAQLMDKKVPTSSLAEVAEEMGVEVPIPPEISGEETSVTNYAWGGAETGYGLSARDTLNIGVQINSFLASNQPNKNQLFIIWAGSNDFSNESLPDPEVIVDNIINHIRTLALASPDEKLRFMIPNLPPLGQTPRAQCLGSLYGSEIPLIFDEVSIAFNIFLNTKLNELRKELKNLYSIEIILHKLDVFSLFQKMIIDPAFTNVTDTVRIGNSPCPLEVTDPGNDVVDEEDAGGYLFFDAIHPTTKAHELIAQEALELIDGQRIETEYAD